MSEDAYDSDTDRVVSGPEFQWLNKDPFVKGDTVLLDPDKYGLFKRKDYFIHS